MVERTDTTSYRGRFAPSPTGPLHLGSLLAAVISFLEARRHGGQWLLRMEDLDPPREQSGAASAILRCLEAHGLFWDEAVLYQSERHPAYEAALDELQKQGRLFWCQCSRKDLHGLAVYPGTCRAFKQPRHNSAIRLRVETRNDLYEDGFQGRQAADPAADCGDVILKRRDQYYAYQLAVVVDDASQGITDIVRGIDLLHTTFWQRALFSYLNCTMPRFHHFPVIVAANGQKLSKQNHAPALDNQRARENLAQVLALLGLSIEPNQPETMLRQASSLWQPEALIGVASLQG